MTQAFIEKLSHDGRGIARIAGKTTFIEGALPGEVVTFTYTRKKRDYDEARTLAVETKAPERVAPRCEHHAICGGCSLQHLHEQCQIDEKEKLMLDMLHRIGHVVPHETTAPLVGESFWHYRNRARLSVNFVEKKNRVLVGFREKHHPRYVADIQRCFILNKQVGDALPALSTLIESMDNPRIFPQIEVSVGEADRVALVFRHLSLLSDADKARFCEFSDATGFLIYLQPQGIDSIALFYPNIDNQLSYQLPNHHIRFDFYPADFTQVNFALNRAMVDQALAWLDLTKDDVVLDLFCGLGNFSLPMARYCRYVVGIEGGRAMVSRAEHNASQNEITNVSFDCQDLEASSVLSTLSHYQFTKLLLDPPRTGAFTIVKQIEQLSCERIVYVSCNPATFARDAAVLVHEKGYQLLKVCAMDMFPHTTHVEVMGLFQKG